MIMFLGMISSASSGSEFLASHAIAQRIATARLASFCPITCLSSFDDDLTRSEIVERHCSSSADEGRYIAINKSCGDSRPRLSGGVGTQAISFHHCRLEKQIGLRSKEQRGRLSAHEPLQFFDRYCIIGIDAHLAGNLH